MIIGAIMATLIVSADLTAPVLAADEAEAACVEAARSSGHLPSYYTRFSAVAGIGRAQTAFVRVTWAVTERGSQRWQAYRCTFDNGLLIRHEPETPPLSEANRLDVNERPELILERQAQRP